MVSIIQFLLVPFITPTGRKKKKKNTSPCHMSCQNAWTREPHLTLQFFGGEQRRVWCHDLCLKMWTLIRRGAYGQLWSRRFTTEQTKRSYRKFQSSINIQPIWGVNCITVCHTFPLTGWKHSKLHHLCSLKPARTLSEISNQCLQSCV